MVINNGVLEKPSTRARIIAWMVDGWPDKQIADAITTKSKPVTVQAVNQFRHRHKLEIDSAVAEVEYRIEDAAIANKAARIHSLNDRWQRQWQVIHGRAADASMAEVPGGSSGLLVRQYKQLGKQIVPEYKVDAGLLAEMRATEREAADELGQLPRPEVNIDARTLATFTIHFDSPAIAQLEAGNITPPLTLESTEEPNEPAN